MKLRMLVVTIVLLAALGQVALLQQGAKPLTKDQIMTVVTAGMDNADLAKQIEARGIDFDLTDDYLQALRKAGAQEVVITALRTVKPSPSPMSRDQLLLLVAGGVPSERAAALVKQRGLNFIPDEEYLQSLRTAGADDALIAVVRGSKPPEVQKHLARAAECEQHHAWAEAEKEYRAALALAPGNNEILQKAEFASRRQKPPQYKLVRSLDAGQHLNGSVVFSSDARWIANGDPITGVDIVEVATGRRVTLPSESKAHAPIAFSPDGRWLATARWGDGIDLWDVASGSLARTLTGPSDAVFSLVFRPDGRMLAVGSGAGKETLTLLELASGKPLYAVEVAQARAAGKTSDAVIRHLAFSPDGRRIASGSDDQTVQLRDASTGQELRTFAGDSTDFCPNIEVDFSPDGRWLVSATGSLKIWDLASGNEIRPADVGKTGYAWHLAFSPDGDWLLTSDAMVNTWWEVATGRKVSQFYDRDTKHQGTSGAAELRFSADGKWLAIHPPNFPITLWERQD